MPRSSPLARTVHRFSESEFIKEGVRDLQREVDKATRLHEVAAISGFVAPQVMGSDARTGSIRLERIHHLVSFREAYLKYVTGRAEQVETVTTTREIGKVLARIHCHLQLTDWVSWEPPEGFRRLALHCFDTNLLSDLESTPVCFLHGDFGFSNVCLTGDRGHQKVVIIDPSANGFVTCAANIRGPVYVDLANFTSCLEGLVPLRHHARIRWPRVEQLKREFLAGYEQEARIHVDLALLGRMSYLTAAAYLQHRVRSAILRRMAMMLLFNSLKGNVPT